MHHSLFMNKMASNTKRSPLAVSLIFITTLFMFLLLVIFMQASDVGRFTDPPQSLSGHTAPSNALDVVTTPAISSVQNPAAKDTSAINMQSLDDRHPLAAGDKLSFRIVEDNEDPKSLLVNDNGELEVPYIGRFPAAGKTCRKAAREIKAELEKDFYHQATVIIAVDLLAKTLGKVYIVGSVRIPGPQDIPGNEVFTVSKAVMRAGGFGEFGDKNHVKITRRLPGKPDGPSQVLVVRVGDILEKGRTDLDITLEPGDLIFVPNRLVSF